MNFPHEIFRAYDIRGVVGTALTCELAARIGHAIGDAAMDNSPGAATENLPAKPGAMEFVVGRDGRASGGALAAAVINGLRDRGCDVIDIGQVPTPAVYFAASARGGNGIAVTGSHNPPPYNGLKIMAGGVTLAGNAIQNIKQRTLRGDPKTHARGGVRRMDALTKYQQAVVADIRLRRPLKVVLDCGNGVAGVIAAKLYRAMGYEVVELFTVVDGDFPNHHPDPSQPKNLTDLIAAVRARRADLGLAFDGDGDRLGVVDGDGDIIWPDRQMILFAQHMLAATPGAEIIFDVKCSRALPRAIRALGGVATMCKTGHSFIKQKLHSTGAVLAGEMSGHLFFNDRWRGFDDGLYAGARLCELIAADPRPPREIFAALPNSVNTPELVLPMREGEPQALVAELIAAARRREGVFADAEISTLDGLRADFADGFGLARASNTSPALSMRFEAATAARLAEIQNQFRALLRQARAGLQLPF